MLRKDIPIIANGRETCVYVYGSNKLELLTNTINTVSQLRSQGYIVLGDAAEEIVAQKSEIV